MLNIHELYDDGVRFIERSIATNWCIGLLIDTEGGRRFMAAWREEEEDAARHRQEKREATRLGKLQSHTEA